MKRGCMMSDLSLLEQIKSLEPLVEKLTKETDKRKKLKILDDDLVVRNNLMDQSFLELYFKNTSLEGEIALKSILALGQGLLVFQKLEEYDPSSEEFLSFLETLILIENFYDVIGGIVGYHCTVLKAILKQETENGSLPISVQYLKPQGLDLRQDSSEVRKAVRWGIENFPKIAEIFPVGGAGDRLDLHDEKTGEALPAAALLFCKRTLLEGLFRDLQGHEYLHYKLCNQKIMTPVAMMTSHEKNNHHHILNICEQNQWFGRPKESFRFFVQPLVPMITKEGNWAIQAPLKLVLKPGGHGVIWKLAEDNHIFSWLESEQRAKAIVRQINNPVASVDYGILALVGLGCQHDKAFGFASCYRLLNTAEGMNVLVERKRDHSFDYCISNIEYTDFNHKGIKDLPVEPGSKYSQFPANTNILFVDLEEVRRAIKQSPLPGMLINMKTEVTTLDSKGNTQVVLAARLESTMQNIADSIVDTFDHRLNEGEQQELKTFLTYNDRRKTISVTKKSHALGKTILETPVGCFFEYLENQYDLLSNCCGMQIPSLGSEEDYLSNGPSFLAFFHPALGPLYSIIAQKIQNGILSYGSELFLEIAEVEIRNLNLEGSLLILADDVVGKRDAEGVIHYGIESGKCILKNVTVKNAGIDRTAQNEYWKYRIERKESLTIVLRGNAEFVAEDIHFFGDYYIEVPDGSRIIARQNKEKVFFDIEKIQDPSWHWHYAFDNEDHIVLEKRG